MKKRIIISLAILFFPACLLAQSTTPAPPDEYPQAGFHLGARYQTNLNLLRINKNDVYGLSRSSSSGSAFGVSLAYFFSNHFSTQLEIIYTGVEQKYTVDNKYDRSIRLSYINIPFLLGLHSNYGKFFSVNAMAGPQLGLNTGSSLTGSETSEYNPVLVVNSTDIGLAYGGGLDFGFGSDKHVHLNVGLRGVLGLTSIQKSEGTLVANEYYILENSKLNTVGAYLGLTFKL